MKNGNGYKTTIVWIIILLGLTAAFWSNGSYFLPIILTTIAAGNLCNALLKGRSTKKIGRSLELAVLLIGIALALSTQFLPGIFLTIIVYILVRSGLRRLQRRPQSRPLSYRRPGAIPPYPQQPPRPISPPQSASYPLYNQGYQAKPPTPVVQQEDEPYIPYQPAQSQTSTTTTTQFEQPQVEYPEELPPQ